MLYTGIYISDSGVVAAEYFDASHDSKAAWKACKEKLAGTKRVIAIVPGKHEIVTELGRLGYSYGEYKNYR